MVKVFFIGIGFAERYLEEIKVDLQRRLCVTEVGDEVECDVIVALCPIVSRAGTDVEAALNVIPSSKPTLVMVLHRTIDPDDIIPNTQKYVEGRGMTLDLLFNEEGGLLSCRRNENSKGLAAIFLSQYETPSPRYSDISSNATRLPIGNIVVFFLFISLLAFLFVLVVVLLHGTVFN